MRKKHFICWLASLATINFLAAQTVLADNGKILLELFTSQSCYSCPPADALLKSLDESQPDIVVLEYHVDYWDDLQWGNAGNWKDPYSQPAFSKRQRRYHQAQLSGRSGVYTPQLIINGATALVGSQERQIKKQLGKLNPPDISINWQVQDGKLNAEFIGRGNSAKQGGIWLARFIREATTVIPAGENNGKTLKNHHIVTELQYLGPFSGHTISIDAPKNQNQGCALFIQSRNLGSVQTAVYCPE